MVPRFRAKVAAGAFCVLFLAAACGTPEESQLVSATSPPVDPRPAMGAAKAFLDEQARQAVLAQQAAQEAAQRAAQRRQQVHMASVGRAAVAEPAPSCAAGDDQCIWDRIAQCESGGNWATNTGNGYFGGLQMDMQFWRSYGGPAIAPRPDLAFKADQIIVARRARDSGRGYRPWPVCGRFAR